MREMLVVIVVLVGQGLIDGVVLFIDGCFFGVIYGLMIGYVVFEVVVGGFIGCIQEGDIIIIDVDKRCFDVDADLIVCFFWCFFVC